MNYQRAIKLYLSLSFIALIGFVLSIGVGTVTSIAFTQYSSVAADISRGEVLFIRNCMGCHATQPHVVGGFGPNLHNIGELASRRIEGVHPQDYILESIIHPDSYRAEGASGHMPGGIVAGFQVEDVRSLVAYVASLGGVVDSNHLQKLVIDLTELAPKSFKVDVAELKHGEDLFFNKLACSKCHEINGIPGSDLRAPSLGKAGILSEEYILSSIRMPSDSIADIWRMTTVQLKDSHIFRGRILSNAPPVLLMLTTESANGGLLVAKTLNMQDIKKVTSSEISTMPPYTLTIRDELALVAFLRSLVAEL